MATNFAAIRKSDFAASARLDVDQAGPWLCLGLPKKVEWKRAQLPIAGLADELAGTRLIHLTDLHLRPQWATGYDHLIKRINAANADLLLITGDFVENKHDYRPAWPVVRRFIEPLRARLGVYGVLGNHDSEMLGVHLSELGVRLIEHQRRIMGSGIELVGFGGVDRLELDESFIGALPPKALGHARIALCHYPDLFDQIRLAKPDVYLSGHTHGGQICLPGGWPPLTHCAGPRRYARGIHYRDGVWYVVNRGVGAGKIPVRIFCPPEIIEIELVAA